MDDDPAVFLRAGISFQREPPDLGMYDRVQLFEFLRVREHDRTESRPIKRVIVVNDATAKGRRDTFQANGTRRNRLPRKHIMINHKRAKG
jgi:hypothetical protein